MESSHFTAIIVELLISSVLTVYFMVVFGCDSLATLVLVDTLHSFCSIFSLFKKNWKYPHNTIDCKEYLSNYLGLASIITDTYCHLTTVIFLIADCKMQR